MFGHRDFRKKKKKQTTQSVIFCTQAHKAELFHNTIVGYRIISVPPVNYWFYLYNGNMKRRAALKILDMLQIMGFRK